MKRYIKRLITAAIISSGCYYATHVWYHSYDSKVTVVTEKKEIARLIDQVNDVQRKPLARVIWENLSQGEMLYAGEAIRTTDTSEAKILFLKTGAVIELEPDSLVVLEENEDGIALDFLQGNLLVKSSGDKKASGGLKLKSGKSEINLNNANLSLSRSKAGEVDLQVFKGAAQLTQGGKTLELSRDKSGILSADGIQANENLIQIKSPTPGEPVYIDPRKKERVTFNWVPLPPGYNVYLEWGRKRNVLQRYTKRFAKGIDGKFAIRTKVGKLYWRLVAVPTIDGLKELRSPVTPSEILAKVPPTLLEPKDKDKVVAKAEDPHVTIKWATRTKLDSLIVEVAKDPMLKTKVLTEELDNKLTFAKLPITQTGTYYWRITGFMDIKGKPSPVSSDIYSFNMQVGVNLVPPELRSPLVKQKVSYSQIATNGLFFSWDPVPGIENYEITIQRVKRNQQSREFENFGKAIVKTAHTSPLKFANFESGVYKWSVKSIDKDKMSKPSQARLFQVQRIPKIEWASGPALTKHYYITDKPNLIAKWLPLKGAAPDQWRVRYAKKGELSDSTPWQTTKTNSFNTYVNADDIYELEVEAISSKGQAIARSSIKEIEVIMQPLLPGPQFAKSVPEIIKANSRGTFDVTWEPIEGAKSYIIEIKDEKGKVSEAKTVDRNLASVKRMRPGKYEISVKAVDKYNRTGANGEIKPLEVPNKSYIKAPKLNKINVK